LIYANGLGLLDVKKICINFAMKHATLFFTHSEAKGLEFGLYQELVGILAEHYNDGKQYDFDEPQITTSDHIKKQLKALYNSRSESGDVAIVMGDKSIKAHKCILWGHSKALDELITTSESNQSITIDQEKFPLVNDESFEEILKFFYYDHSGLELSAVCRMFKYAFDMDLAKLSKNLEHIISTYAITPKAIPFALEVAINQLPNNQGLAAKFKDRTLTAAVQHFPDIPLQYIVQMDPAIGATLVMAIQSVLRDYISKGVEPSYHELIRGTAVNVVPVDENRPELSSARSKGKGKMPRRKSLKT